MATETVVRWAGQRSRAVVHSRDVVVLFVDTQPAGAIAFHHDFLVADDPKTFFRLTGTRGKLD
ncbi:hypothetical protein ASG86_10125 [Arthrobacter sp. Soil764]|nr:hypothetical protein ASG86_10125 [Arthrobacter sp. Soil764]